MPLRLVAAVVGGTSWQTLAWGASCMPSSFEDSSLLQARSTLKKAISSTPVRDDAQQPDGYGVEFPLDYSLSSINTTVKNMREKGSEYDSEREREHKEASTACSKTPEQGDRILKYGGWCYDVNTSRQVKGDGKTQDHDFWLPAHHVVADTLTANILASSVLRRQDGSCCHSVTDLGAGVGQFGHALKARLPELEYRGYDGAGNVEEFTNGFVRWANLAKPLNAPPSEWVFTSEVGEHIPHNLEAQFIANIHANNCRGIILSWAVLNQGRGGHGHVNCHSTEYMENIFTSLGYKVNTNLTQALRAKRPSNESTWLEPSATVYDRLSRPDFCGGL